MFSALLRRVFGTKDTPPHVLTAGAMREMIATLPSEKPPAGMRWCLNQDDTWTLVKIEKIKTMPADIDRTGAAERGSRPKAKRRTKSKAKRKR